MIARPYALLRHFGEFSPVCMDYGNVVTAAISQSAQHRWWHRLKPSELSIDLGKMAGTISKIFGLSPPELKAKWNIDL